MGFFNCTSAQKGEHDAKEEHKKDETACNEETQEKKDAQIILNRIRLDPKRLKVKDG